MPRIVRIGSNFGSLMADDRPPRTTRAEPPFMRVHRVMPPSRVRNAESGVAALSVPVFTRWEIKTGGRGMLHIRQMGPQIGVEVTGIDVKTMGGATWNRIYQAWLDHNVMVVRDQ